MAVAAIFPWLSLAALESKLRHRSRRRRPREQNSLIWLLARPLPRPAIYLAKFVALLPWTVGLNMGGFALVCAAAGRPGLTALRLFWPAVLCATLAFAALFQMIGAAFRRPAIVAIGYSFFLEIILGNMPGVLKRVSVGFYAHCMMLEAADRHGIEIDRPNVYWPVDGTTAIIVLMTATAAAARSGHGRLLSKPSITRAFDRRVGTGRGGKTCNHRSWSARSLLPGSDDEGESPRHGFQGDRGATLSPPMTPFGLTPSP